MRYSRSWVPRQASPIGLDLGARMVRMLQLSRQGSQVSVTACAEREIPLTTTGEELESRQVSAVEEMLRGGAFRGRDVVAALAWDDLLIRSIRIPLMPEEKIPDAIRIGGSDGLASFQHPSEVRFLVAGDVREGTGLCQEVILLGTSRCAVKAHIRKLARMGLRPVAIDAGPCALFRGFERLLRRDEDAGQVNTFVDVGYGSSRVVIARGAELAHIKIVPVGGQRFDKLVSEQLALDLEEAAQLRVRLHTQHVAELTGQTGRLPPEERISDEMRRTLLDALRPALEQLAKEVSLCLRYHSITFRGGRPDSITVLGGEACNSDMLRFLSDQLNVPFHIGKPMRNLAVESPFATTDRRTGQPEWATVLGLALKPAPRALAVAS